jgi:transcriptional regulator
MHGWGHLPLRLTIRQTIQQMLGQEPWSAQELASALLLTPGEVEGHLAHLQRSLKRRLKVEPACCRSCGYVFEGRRRLDAPGRCPACRGQRIDGPWFRVGEA